MMQQNNVPWALNSYIVKTAAGACGYYSSGPDGVALAMNCLGPVNHTWGHEIGHQLTLPHTFYGWEGTTYNNSEPAPEQIGFRGAWVQVERADGSNCRHAADGFCDTPADYVSSRWSCTDSNPMGQTLIDPTGESFAVDGRNIMSYSSGTCRSTFSAEQIQAMRMNLLLHRNHIIDFEASYQPVPPDVSFINPTQGSEVQYDNTTVSWESVPNATEYRVQLTNLPFFQNLVVNEVVTDTFLRLPVLTIGNNYMLRVQSMSNFQPCNDYSETLTFVASDLSYVHNPGAGGGEFYFENPLRTGSDLVIHHRNGGNMSEKLQISVLDIGGRVVGQSIGSIDASSGVHLPTNNLSAGTYLIRFDFDGYPPQVRKLVLIR